MSSIDSPAQHDKSITVGKKSRDGTNEIDSYSCDYVTYRLDSIEEKVLSAFICT